VLPPGRGMGLARQPSARWGGHDARAVRRSAPSGNGHCTNCWANGDGLEQAETRSRPAVGFMQGRRGSEIAGPTKVLAQEHCKALLNFETFRVSKYI
jgi:hypothetical protein